METEASRRVRKIVLEIRRRRAERLGLPVPEDVPEPAYRHGMSIGEAMRAERHRMRSRRKAEEAGTLVTSEAGIRTGDHDHDE
jgi:hypothetical protein